MGVLNVTPDSFSDGAQFLSLDKALAHAEQMIADGADIIDIGGESTRPGAELISPEDELQRVLPVIKELAKRIKCSDLYRYNQGLVARAALDAGAAIVNEFPRCDLIFILPMRLRSQARAWC